LTCYHIDDEYSFSPVESPTSPEEVRLIERSDLVIVHSPGLMQKKGGINPRTTQLPLGVDYLSFSSPWPEPEDLRAIPHPRIGYLGRLKKQLDWPLLHSLASRHPQWQFVLIGAASHHAESVRGIESIQRLPNVHLLGFKPSVEMPRYTQHLDVCLMPYVPDDYARYGYPLKLHEYLASGRPAVGVRMRTLEDFVDVVSLPGTPEEWSDAIRWSLGPEANSPENIRKRQKVAEEHDWNLLVRRLASLFREALGERSGCNPAGGRPG
jgi:glycosyltransferase involved in cell wall biosynthesis